MSRPNPRGRTLLLVAAAAAVGLVLLVAWTHRMRAAELEAARAQEGARVAAIGLQEAIAPIEPSYEAAPVRAFDLQLAELIEELRLLRRAIESHGLPSAREEVPPSDPARVATDARLDELERLVTRLESRSSPTARRPLQLPPLERRVPDLVSFHRSLEDARAQDLDDEFLRRYFLWTRQQVLDHFGVPDTIWVDQNGAVLWGYSREQDDETLYDFTLRFHDGLVAAVW